MSFGYSVGDAVLLVQLAWSTFQGAKKACGEHDELTREVGSLHRVLQRLQRELANPDSLLNRADDDRRQELSELGGGCEQILNIMNTIVSKYNALAEVKRSPKKIWKRIQFGNGEMHDLADLRSKLSTHTSAITLSINLCSLGSQGRVEKQLNNVGGDLEGIRERVDWLAANMATKSGEGTVWTSYEDDDKAFWRELRRGLIKEGYPSSVLRKHRHLIKKYVVELGSRGVFDQEEDTLILEDGEDATTAEGGPESSEIDLQEAPRGNDEPENLETDDEESVSLEAVTKLPPVQPERPLPEDSDEAEHSNEDESSVDGNEEHETHLTVKAKGQTKNQIETKRQDADELNISSLESVEPELSNSTEDIITESTLLTTSSGKGKEPASDQDNASDAKPLYTLPNFLFEDDYVEYVLHDSQGYIHFRDHLGRNFAFPFLLVNTYKGMQKLLNRTFGTLDTIDHIEKGRYDLVCPNGDIILPLAWEHTIQPEWLVVMVLWTGLSNPTDDRPFALRATGSVLPIDPISNSLPLQVPPLHIKFKDAVGRTYSFPFNLVTNWDGMDKLITQAFRDVEILEPLVQDCIYELVQVDSLSDPYEDGSVVLPRVWEHSIQPLSAFRMFMMPIGDPAAEARKSLEARKSFASPSLPTTSRGGQPESSQTRTSPPLQEQPNSLDALKTKSCAPSSSHSEEIVDASPSSFSVQRTGPKHVVTLTDCVGLKFVFPFEMVRARNAMREQIDLVFFDVDILGPVVKSGWYSLFRTSDHKEIRRDNWEDMIVPGLEIIMKVWPHPEFSYSKVTSRLITCPLTVSGVGALGGTVHPWAPGIEHYSSNNVPPPAGHSQSHGGPSSSETPASPFPPGWSGWDKKSKVEELEQRIGRAKMSKQNSNGVLDWMAEPHKKAQESKQNSKGVLDWMAEPTKKAQADTKPSGILHGLPGRSKRRRHKNPEGSK